MADPSPLALHDVIQLDPRSDLGKAWGPQLCVVDKLYDWGVRAYFIHASERTKFGPAYLRVPTSTFVRVGAAEWVVNDGAND